MSVHGPILSLNSKISIAPISAFRPRRWKGKIVNDKSKITIKNLNPKKRPISAVADNIESRNAKVVNVKISHKIKFNLLYDRNSSLQKKIKLEQLRKRNIIFSMIRIGASTRTRTANLLITNQLLYQLSYEGINDYIV